MGEQEAQLLWVGSYCPLQLVDIEGKNRAFLAHVLAPAAVQRTLESLSSGIGTLAVEITASIHAHVVLATESAAP